MTNGGIFGPKLSGKTTLAKSISREYWRKGKVRSYVLDINKEGWGEHAFVTADESKFWPVVWQTRNSLIIVDEATETIKRDKQLIPVFTRLRHLNHRLLVIGHNGINLLPIMREQLDVVYLFRQPKRAADIWAENFAEEGLLDATSLGQYEFIRFESYGKPQRMKLSVPKARA